MLSLAYSGFDDLPAAARKVIAESKWLGMLQEWQIRQIPRSSDIVQRLKRADRAMCCGNNVEARFTEKMMAKVGKALYPR